MNNRENVFSNLFLLALVGIICVIGSCKKQSPTGTSSNPMVPHAKRFGIYALDLEAETVELIISSAKEFSKVRLNHAGDTFVFSQKIDGDDNEHTEIFTVSINSRWRLSLRSGIDCQSGDDRSKGNKAGRRTVGVAWGHNFP